jgi:hypothetical protein
VSAVGEEEAGVTMGSELEADTRLGEVVADFGLRIVKAGGGVLRCEDGISDWAPSASSLL